ncbi:MAG: sodium:proton antiporter [Nocardioides sp.]|nr:sodium:proton antiporter [Nocardioides sp.]
MRQTRRPDEPDPSTLTRNWNELLQELRVVQTGVQILTGFLVTVPFTQRFPDLDAADRAIYLTVLCGAVLVTGLVMAPVAYHRVLFRRRQRWWLVEAANVTARIGLVLLALVSAGVVLLVFSVVVSHLAGIVAAGSAIAVIAVLWLVVPSFR